MQAIITYFRYFYLTLLFASLFNVDIIYAGNDFFNPIIQAFKVFSDNTYLTQFLGEQPENLVKNLVNEATKNNSLASSAEKSKLVSEIGSKLIRMGNSPHNLPEEIWNALWEKFPVVSRYGTVVPTVILGQNFIFSFFASIGCIGNLFTTIQESIRNSEKTTKTERLKSIALALGYSLGSIGWFTLVLQLGCKRYLTKRLVSALTVSAKTLLENKQGI